jgi:hypothetical protein
MTTSTPPVRRGRGKAQKSLDLIEAAYRILAQIQPASVRAVCYKLFNEKLIVSMAKSETNRVGTLLTWARENDRIPWEWIVDGTRAIERPPSWDSPEDVLQAAARGYRRDWWEQQRHRVLLCSEKSTVAGTVRPVTDQYGVGFFSLHGYSSATSTHDIAELSLEDDRPLTLLYIGDWDPSGVHMSARDLPDRLKRYGGVAKVVRIALDRIDILGRNLPWFSAEDKRKDPRYGWFTQGYGSRCWELDALDPNVLRERVERHIRLLIDWDAWNRCAKVEEVERASLLEVVGAWKESRG